MLPVTLRAISTCTGATDGVLITGDAVVTVDLNSALGILASRQGVFGPPRYSTWDGAADETVHCGSGRSGASRSWPPVMVGSGSMGRRRRFRLWREDKSMFLPDGDGVCSRAWTTALGPATGHRLGCTSGCRGDLVRS